MNGLSVCELVCPVMIYTSTDCFSPGVGDPGCDCVPKISFLFLSDIAAKNLSVNFATIFIGNLAMTLVY